MNIGTIVSTVQAEPLNLGEDSLQDILEKTFQDDIAWTVLVNEEITPEIKEDIFA